MLQLSGDGSDTQSQRAAFAFLSKSVTVWGQPSDAANGEVVPGSQGVPGFECFVYENVVPTSFAVLSLPDLNIKDGQVIVVRVTRSAPAAPFSNFRISGPPRNCRPFTNDWESPGRGSLQVLCLRLSTRAKLACRDCIRIYDEDARSGFEAVPQIFRRFRQGFTIWLIVT